MSGRQKANITLKTLEENYRSVLALFFPWCCPGCNKLLPFPDAVCETCSDSLKPIRKPFCKKCGDPFPQQWSVVVCANCKLKRLPLTRVRSLFYYEGLVKRMIGDVKYRRQQRLLGYFAGHLYDMLRLNFPRPEALVAVPLHREREWDRRFNQSAVLAKNLSRLSGIPVWNALCKNRRTLPQSGLSGEARRRNLQDCFAMHHARKCPRSVMLLDDVMTTGTTLNECAAVLRKAGVKRVYGLTIARAVLNDTMTP